MKKTLSLLLAAVLLLALLAACGSAGAPASGSNLSPAPAATKAPAQSEAPAATEAPAPTEEPAPTEAPAESAAPAGVASAEQMTTVEEVVEEGMVPVYAESLKDGVWPVVMKSSSSMFKADRCELVVENGKLSVILYMSSEAYPWMFAGTAEEAVAAPEEARIPLTDASFTLPLNALDDGEAFAAFSKRKELWYDRTLLFRADSLPAEAFAEGFFTTAASLGLADGDYTAEVALSGGSGRASVTSPAPLTVADGLVTARIEWSSKNYDYMRIDEEKFLPVNAEGENSAFEIPVAYFDRPLTVYADTTAMSEPHEIEYTLSFDSASLAAVG